jgi:hypothetical protein
MERAIGDTRPTKFRFTVCQPKFSEGMCLLNYLQSCLVLSYTRLVLGERSPLGRAAALLARCPPPMIIPLPQTWTCCAVQIVTRVPLSLYLGPRLVNVVSLRKRPNSLHLQHKLSPYPDALQHLG